ncbi:hypothetical protein K1719_037596 [Acacia pycnantha]|nr:hypothetical protein K1719_037596 [Acacia pycnantha]
MKNEKAKDTCNKLVLTINNFSTLNINHRHRSELFTTGGCAWKIALYRGREDVKYLGIFLEVADPWTLPRGWSISASFTIHIDGDQSSFHRKI